MKREDIEVTTLRMKLRRAIWRVPAFIPIVVLVACTHAIPEHQANPVSEQMIMQSDRTLITIPAHTAQPPLAPVVIHGQQSAPSTYLPLTLTGDLTPIERLVRSAVPDTINESGHPLSSDFRWTFTRMSEPQISIYDGWITTRTEYVGHIETKGMTSRACRLDPVYPVLEQTAQLDFRPAGDNVMMLTLVNPQTHVSLKPGSDMRCNMFNVPLEQQVRELMNADAIHARMAGAVQQAGMRMHISDRLHGPFAFSVLPSAGQLCLYPGPSEVMVGRLEGNERQAVLRGVVRVSPTTVINSPCPAPAITPVVVRSGSIPAGQPLTIVSGVVLPHETLSEIVGNKLRSAEIAVGEYGETFQIQSVRTSDASGKVLLAVDTTGYLNGTIYFWGSPQLEVQPQTGATAIAIPDLRLDPESKRMLETVQPGLGPIVDRRLTWMVREAARIDLTDRIAKVQTAVVGPHRAGDVTVTFTIIRPQPGIVYSTPQGLVTDVTLETTGTAVGRFDIQG